LLSARPSCKKGLLNWCTCDSPWVQHRENNCPFLIETKCCVVLFKFRINPRNDTFWFSLWRTEGMIINLHLKCEKCIDLLTVFDKPPQSKLCILSIKRRDEHSGWRWALVDIHRWTLNYSELILGPYNVKIYLRIARNLCAFRRWRAGTFGLDEKRTLDSEFTTTSHLLVVLLGPWCFGSVKPWILSEILRLFFGSHARDDCYFVHMKRNNARFLLFFTCVRQVGATSIFLNRTSSKCQRLLMNCTTGQLRFIVLSLPKCGIISHTKFRIPRREYASLLWSRPC
jgi:hypothetical protein